NLATVRAFHQALLLQRSTTSLTLQHPGTLSLQILDLTLQFTQLLSGFTLLFSQRLGFAAGLLALGDGQGFLLTLQCQIVLQHSQLVRAFIQLLFSLGNFSLQLDALQIGGSVVHRVLTVLGVHTFGQGFVGGLEDAPELTLLEQGHVIGHAFGGEQQAGTKAAVIGGTQLLYGTGLNQLLQLSHSGVVISRGRCGRRRSCWSRYRGYLFNLLLLGLRHHGPLWFLYQRHRAAR